MKDLVRIFKSPEGDVYHISLSEDKGVLSQEVMETLGNVHVVGIELRRLAGRNTTGQDVRLSVVEVNGINEIYYFHVIYRESHSVLAALIGSDLREGFGK